MFECVPLCAHVLEILRVVFNILGCGDYATREKVGITKEVTNSITKSELE